MQVAKVNRADAEAAASRFQGAVEASPYFAHGWFVLGELRELLGETDAAVAAFRRVRELDAADTFGASLHLVRLGAEPAVAMPEDYVTSLFDDYAARFEGELTGDLSYDAPAQLRDAVEQVCGALRRPLQFASMLDLGCGTGLAGAAFKTCTTVMNGVDLSPRMLALARDKGLYDRLETQEIMRFLAKDQGEPFDLIVAADVFVYFADLAGVLAAAARRLAPDGLIAFTVETYAGDGVRLGDKPRYAHGRAHVEASLESAGLRVSRLADVSTRTEDGQPVPCLLAVGAKA